MALYLYAQFNTVANIVACNLLRAPTSIFKYKLIITNNLLKCGISN